MDCKIHLEYSWEDNNEKADVRTFFRQGPIRYLAWMDPVMVRKYKSWLYLRGNVRNTTVYFMIDAFRNCGQIFIGIILYHKCEYVLKSIIPVCIHNTALYLITAQIRKGHFFSFCCPNLKWNHFLASPTFWPTKYTRDLPS